MRATIPEFVAAIERFKSGPKMRDRVADGKAMQDVLFRLSEEDRELVFAAIKDKGLN